MTTQSARRGQRGTVAVSASFAFSASHELSLLASTHQCSRNHGHNYTVFVTAVVNDGDSGDLSSFSDYIATTFDHRLINDCVDFHPTSELLAHHLASWFQKNVETVVPITLTALEVSETPSSSARWDRGTDSVTISKTYATVGSTSVTVTLSRHHGLDEYGFVTDFGNLAPFAAHLCDSDVQAALRPLGPAQAGQLAWWFLDHVEPGIDAHLDTVRVVDGTTSGQWNRGEAA